jgi:L-alanine-DL-glutamate epimerase-like enolase superfamily enzyme
MGSYFPISKKIHHRFDLSLRHRWTIANDLGEGGGKTVHPVVFVELSDSLGRSGLGEASPSSQYAESYETVNQFLHRLDPRRLSFDDISGSMEYLDSVGPGNFPAKCAVNIALLDGASKALGKPLHTFLGLNFPDPGPITSFSIGIDQPELMAAKAREAESMPILKIKLGGPNDRLSFQAVRDAAPKKILRVDANSAWTMREQALENIQWLAADGRVEFVEQPMPPNASEADMRWLKDRSPLPIFADESYQNASDVTHVAMGFHGVNVKLVKTGGVSAARKALEIARAHGLKTMIGCMIESSVLISAAAHLASLADHLDLDGNLLVDNDPYVGVGCHQGRLEFSKSPYPAGLEVGPRQHLNP